MSLQSILAVFFFLATFSALGWPFETRFGREHCSYMFTPTRGVLPSLNSQALGSGVDLGHPGSMGMALHLSKMASERRSLSDLMKIRFGDRYTEINDKEDLDFSDMDLTDAEMLYLIKSLRGNVSFPNLRRLDLSLNPRLTERSLAPLIKAIPSGGLIELNLQGTGQLEGNSLGILMLVLKGHRDSLRKLALANANSAHLNRILLFNDLRHLDLHQSAELSRRGGLARRSTLLRFVRSRPEKLHTLVLPANLNHTLIEEIVAVANQDLARGQPKLKVKTEASLVSLPPQKYRVVIGDGDTISFSVPGGDAFSGVFDVRLLGVDAGEITSSRPEELALAKAAQIFLNQLVLKADRIRVSNMVPDKYNKRYLGRVWLRIRGRWVHLNKLLIEHGLALPYHGSSRSAHARLWPLLFQSNRPYIEALLESFPTQ